MEVVKRGQAHNGLNPIYLYFALFTCDCTDRMHINTNCKMAEVVKSGQPQNVFDIFAARYLASFTCDWIY